MEPQVSFGERLERSNAMAEQSHAVSTISVYRRYWKMFETWCDQNGVPTTKESMSVYLNEADLSQSALMNVAKAARFIDPPEFAGEIRDKHSSTIANRNKRGMLRMGKGQASGLTLPDLRQMVDSGSVDQTTLALIAVMHSAMLRRSEACALTWADVGKGRGAGGSVYIARSKTDQAGDGAWTYLSPLALRLLEDIAPRNRRPGDIIFAFNPRQVNMRIRTAAKRAGLDGLYSGHSPRVGAAQDLGDLGVSTSAIQTAGRWKDINMPARYAAAASLEHGAMAKLYAGENGESGDDSPGSHGEYTRAQHLPI